MIRPCPIPESVKTALAQDPNVPYTTRQRIMASLSGWANRDGPVKNGPSAAMLRDIAPVEPGTERHDQAIYIDAIQTALVAAQTVAPGECPRLQSLLVNALRDHGWHP